jgi:type VI secretion system protein ImpK
MTGDPFSEPNDGERTLIRPMPGGRRAAPSPPPLRQSEAPPVGPAPAGEAVDSLAMGVNPLVAAAAPLLQLLARLRNTLNSPNPAELRERTVRAMSAFEERTRASGLPIELIRPAHYALCASLDDAVLNTPWGGTGGVWDARSLVSTFHQEVRSGERFFDLYAQMRQNPGRFLPVIELMYLCISLGFQGLYRLSPRGPAELDRLREEGYALIARERQGANPELSPHWRGIAAPYRGAMPIIPLWVAASVAFGGLALLFAGFALSLGSASDTVFAQMLREPPTQMPKLLRPIEAPPPPPPKPPPYRICGQLEKLASQGVSCDPTTHIVRILNRGMFASGSATVERKFAPVLESVGRALAPEPGKIELVGYTDDQPVHTVSFPSNFDLSVARARAARAIIAGAVSNPDRLVAEGRGEADPIADNTKSEGREQNRRIEIVLHPPS